MQSFRILRPESAKLLHSQLPPRLLGKARLIAAAALLVTTPCLGAPPDSSTTLPPAPTSKDAPSTAAAPPTSPADAKKKAMEHFATGLNFYEDGEFSLALIEFERAYSYVPDFRVLYNIGQVSIQLGRYARAVRALEQYLQQGGTSLAAARVDAVKADLRMLEGRTAHLELECDTPDAEILLDDVRIATTPVATPLLIDSGEHRLLIQKAGYVSRTERLVVAGRDEIKLSVSLAKVQATPHPSTTIGGTVPAIVIKQPSGPATEPMSLRTKLLYAGAGTTGLLAIGWAVTGYIGIKAAGDLNDELKHPTTGGELSTLKHRARGWLLASDILGACALGVGGTTLYFTLAAPKRNSNTRVGLHSVNLGVAPAGVLLRTQFF